MQEYWSGLPFPSPVGHILSDLSTMTCPSWVAPRAWLSFIVRQGCGSSVIRLTSFLWVWFQCVCPLMPFCNTYHLTWVSLTLGVGYLLTAALPDLQCGIAPLGPPVPAQPPLLGRLLADLLFLAQWSEVLLFTFLFKSLGQVTSPSLCLWFFVFEMEINTVSIS